jgi:CcmD family protein
MIKYLYAAYGVTWAVHVIYVVILTRGFKKVQEEIEDLERR